ncbi:MAG: hypothetical protein WBO07_05870 [Formosimonas sp.]
MNTLFKISQRIIIASMFLMALSVHGQTIESKIFVCPQPDGSIRLQNLSPTKNCTTQVITTKAPVRMVRSGGPNNFGDPQPAGNAIIVGGRVSAAAQGSRDAGRAQILSNELSAAQSLLSSLQTEYNKGVPMRRTDELTGSTYENRVATLKRQIELTESNISALQREMARM